MRVLPLSLYKSEENKYTAKWRTPSAACGNYGVQSLTFDNAAHDYGSQQNINKIYVYFVYMFLCNL